MNYEKQLPRKYRKACAFGRTRAICVSLVARLRETRGKGLLKRGSGWWVDGGGGEVVYERGKRGGEGRGGWSMNEIDRGDKFYTIENRATTNSQV